jgi:predicted SAM-dependent methyltransferase
MRELLKSFFNSLGIPAYWLHQSHWELQMALHRAGAFSPWRNRKIRRLERLDGLRLIFGCGETQYSGWVCIDGVKGGNVDLCLDLRRVLPFCDATVDLCYSEHFLEHLAPQEAAQHLGEVYRVLKPGGRYRVVVPAADRFMRKYVEGDDEFFRLAFPWAKSNLDAVYHILNWNGAHRSIFDFECLRQMGLAAGFRVTIESQANASELPVLRIDRSEPQRVAESMYVEMLK